MFKGLSLAFALLWVGCFTRPNPADCADGSCSDPALPFCDVGGEVEHQANTCIAVSCEPQQPRACRGDVLIRCNTSGDNYDLVQCERGCDAVLGCRGCTANDQCNNPSPVCDDTTHECRACAADDECPSRVCAEGTCEPEAAVVYGSPDATSEVCSQSDPCVAGLAIQRASTSTPHPTVRLLPGIYNTPITADVPSTTPVRVVATGATISTSSITLVVGDGANISFRGGTIVGPISCGSPSPSPRSRFSARSTSLMNTEQWTGVNCEFEVTDAAVIAKTSVRIGTDSTLTLDRVNMRSTAAGSSFVMLGQRGKARVTNSIIENMNFSPACSDNCGNSFEMAFTTVVLDQTLDLQLLGCPDSAGMWTAIYENNIFASFGPAPPVGGNVWRGTSPKCTLNNNIMFPQPDAIAGNPVADPQFVNVAARDYHLMPASPARDAAVPSSANLGTDHDLDGVARPQGTKADLGAYESAR